MKRRTILKTVAFAATGLNIADDETARASVAEQASVTPFIERSDHTRLFYKSWGEGKPVVFLHGWGLNTEMWQYQMIYLAEKGVRCIAYDRRGHGRSSDPGRAYDYDTLADDLAALLKQLNLQKVTLVGHSMAGGEIVRYLTRHGANRVARILLLAPTLPFPMKTADNPDGIDPRLFEQVRAMWRKDLPKWLADNTPPFFVPETSPEIQQWGTQMFYQASLKALLDCNRAMTETDFRAELRNIKVPTLIIHGDQDRSAPLELTGRKTASLIPSSTLKVYEGAPHGLFITHMDRLNEDLQAFINS